MSVCIINFVVANIFLIFHVDGIFLVNNDINLLHEAKIFLAKMLVVNFCVVHTNMVKICQILC